MAKDRDPSQHPYEFRSGHKVFSGSMGPDQALQKTLPDPIKLTRSPGPGKGDKPRSFSGTTGDKERGMKWCKMMGHHTYKNGSKNCRDCGHRCRHPRQVTPEAKYTHFRCLECGHEGKVQRGTQRQ